MAKFGLGKGLGALIPESEMDGYDAASRRDPADDGRERVRLVPLGRVEPSPDQPRKDFDEAALDELADSIRQHGVIQPVLVEDAEGGLYRIVAGERRWRAAAKAGLGEIPVIVRTYSREKRLEIALIENIQREDLNPLEEADAYRRLMELTGLSQDELAEKVGKSRSAVANAVRLLKLPQEALVAVRDGRVSAGHARAILSVVDPADQSALLSLVLAEGISVREAEASASSFNKGGRAQAGSKGKAPVKPGLDPDVAALEQNLIGKLGTKVTIKGDAKRGTIVIEYFSMEDLERVHDIIAGG